MNVTNFRINPAATIAATPAAPAVESDFRYQLKSLQAMLADRLLTHVGRLAWVLVDEAMQPLYAQQDADRLASPHIVALLRRLHAAMPSSTSCARNC